MWFRATAHYMQRAYSPVAQPGYQTAAKSQMQCASAAAMSDLSDSRYQRRAAAQGQPAYSPQQPGQPGSRYSPSFLHSTLTE